MVLSGYDLVYGITYNGNKIGKKLLPVLMKKHGITDEKKLESLVLDCDWMKLNPESFPHLLETLKTYEEVEAKGADAVREWLDAPVDDGDRPDRDEKDASVITAYHVQPYEVQMSNRSTHFRIRNDNIECLNALLKLSGSIVRVITKHCCFNDRQVFIGFMCGSNSVIEGDDVIDFASIEDFMSQEVEQLESLKAKYEESKTTIAKDLAIICQIVGPDLAYTKAKFWKFANDCTSCT